MRLRDLLRLRPVTCVSLIAGVTIGRKINGNSTFRPTLTARTRDFGQFTKCSQFSRWHVCTATLLMCLTTLSLFSIFGENILLHIFLIKYVQKNVKRTVRDMLKKLTIFVQCIYIRNHENREALKLVALEVQKRRRNASDFFKTFLSFQLMFSIKVT